MFTMIGSADSADRYVKRLLMLKELDSIIDFSKASNQLVIILYLYSLERPISIRELSKLTGYSRKSILDSIRKLEKKSLVVKREYNRELYVELSPYGKQYMDTLLSVLEPEEETENKTLLKAATRLNVVNELLLGLFLYRLIVFLGLSGKSICNQENVVEITGCDTKTAGIMIASFSQNPSRVFRLLDKKEGQKKLKLDKQGYALLEKTPHYRAYMGSRVFRTLCRVFRTPWVAEISLRINIVFATVYAVLVALTILRILPILPLGIGLLALVLALHIWLNTELSRITRKYKIF
ncbi:MAG: hypothetical protein ABWW65_06000 [Thermoprotei archaeon]